ncbi:hypothetical protein RJ55_00963 [Drechmeria coniospora]|nr:hypothetical protein RJ55_00963 [Drechmeria coniospora]
MCKSGHVSEPAHRLPSWHRAPSCQRTLIPAQQRRDLFKTVPVGAAVRNCEVEMILRYIDANMSTPQRATPAPTTVRLRWTARRRGWIWTMTLGASFCLPHRRGHAGMSNRYYKPECI